MYVIKREEDGMYVARSGSARSYTNDRAQAAEFASIALALKDCCGNEEVYRSARDELVATSGTDV